jgi:hypothetical protein
MQAASTSITSVFTSKIDAFIATSEAIDKHYVMLLFCIKVLCNVLRSLFNVTILYKGLV